MIHNDKNILMILSGITQISELRSTSDPTELLHKYKSPKYILVINSKHNIRQRELKLPEHRIHLNL
jgi:hypothetical protein